MSHISRRANPTRSRMRKDCALTMKFELLEDAMFLDLDQTTLNQMRSRPRIHRHAGASSKRFTRWTGSRKNFDILAHQALCFVNSHYNNLKKVKIAMRAITIGSQLGNWLLRYGQNSANALFSMVSKVNLESLRNFKFYSDEMLCKIQGCLFIILVNQQRYWRRRTWKSDSGMK
jgi:hypothetical protein